MLIKTLKLFRSWLRTYYLDLLIFFFIVFVPLCIFTILAKEITGNRNFSLDHKILLFMQANSNVFLNKFMVFFSRIGSLLCVIPMGLFIFTILLVKRHWRHAFFLLLSIGGAVLLNLVAKTTFGRSRPNLWPSISPETTFSFPSGHAMQSMAIAGGLIVLLWPTKFRWPALTLGIAYVLMVGISRVYLGVHYPSDILAGWAVTIVWIFALSIVFYWKRPGGTPMA